VVFVIHAEKIKLPDRNVVKGLKGSMQGTWDVHNELYQRLDGIEGRLKRKRRIFDY